MRSRANSLRELGQSIWATSLTQKTKCLRSSRSKATLGVVLSQPVSHRSLTYQGSGDSGTENQRLQEVAGLQPPHPFSDRGGMRTSAGGQPARWGSGRRGGGGGGTALEPGDRGEVSRAVTPSGASEEDSQSEDSQSYLRKADVVVSRARSRRIHYPRRSRHRTGTDSPLPSHNRPAQGRVSNPRPSRIPPIPDRCDRARPPTATHNCPVSTDSTLMHDAAQRYQPLSPCSQPHTTQARARRACAQATTHRVCGGGAHGRHT